MESSHAWDFYHDHGSYQLFNTQIHGFDLQHFANAFGQNNEMLRCIQLVVDVWELNFNRI